MNKAITDGLVLMPAAFAAGLDVWSSENGTPGSDTYAGASNAAFVPADSDFGGCLELLKTESTQKLRYMAQTPIFPGCYLRITARVKAISGNLPNVRIAGWAATAGGAHVNGLTELGSSETLQTYGSVVEVSAIVGSGARGGVDMVWGTTPAYGHFGLDLTGSNGGVVRVDDIRIEDITGAFHRDMMNWVDVKDFGAVGNGSVDCAAAFEAADAAADGKRVLVSEGEFFLGSSVTFENPVVFEGTVTMGTGSIFSLTKNFDLPTYINAFGNEELAFKKAFQAMLNNADHESLDLGGRRITITEPIDLQAAVPNRGSYAQRRHIANGQFYVSGDSVWEPDVVTSQATYSTSEGRRLRNVSNAANIQVGSLVSGNGVGREVYVRAVNVATQEITLSQPFYDAAGTQNFTFTRFKYIFDFSGFSKISAFSVSDIEFQCNSKASGILLSPSGVAFHVRDCFFTRPKHRGISSPGEGCQGLLVDRCQFITNEGGTRSQDRISVGINCNANDFKLRNNRASQFRHFAVIGGENAMVTGNHFFQGDDEPDGVRTAGIVFAQGFTSATFDGNYVDNAFLEWSNEYDSEPDFTGGFSFGSLSITDNVFLSGDVAPWFGYIVVKPHGSGHFFTGLNVTGNKFRSINGTIDRVDRVDTSFSDLDMSKGKNVLFAGNTFHNVVTGAHNPLRVQHDQNSHQSTWTVRTEGKLPFGGRARGVDGLVATSKLKDTSNVTAYDMPNVNLEQGSDGSEVDLRWGTSYAGDMTVIVRMD
ncbi:right-handed parallel beta-helix repeat-containing protein [Shimia sp. Alg240-R146]|uniref:right-handed parallel beta-helix repeat-containing protein n=1 Tax=Shimia sp. Alg240-R146 TaxID=2993449 RepID=UPI0022E3BC51|nr:right-handed parallel beta-helix repeat-containing protein [Shimia sp. Alg240-R146]